MKKNTKKVVIAVLLLVVALLPLRESEAKMMRSLDGKYVEVDEGNLAYDTSDDEAEESVTERISISRDTQLKPWLKNGKKYLPFTDSYMSSSKYEKILRKLSQGKVVRTERQALKTTGLKLTASRTGKKVTLTLRNTGKRKLTDVRLYLFQDGKNLRVFADSEQGQVAYGQMKASEASDVEMETVGRGVEDIDQKWVLSTDGVNIGADGDGDIAAGETVVVRLRVK